MLKLWTVPPAAKLGRTVDVKNLIVEKLLRRPRYSVMGCIDKFAVLKSIFTRLTDISDLKRMQKTQSQF